MDNNEIYMQPFLGHRITIKRGTFTGWVGMVHYTNSDVTRKKVQAQTRDEVKAKLEAITGRIFPENL